MVLYFDLEDTKKDTSKQTEIAKLNFILDLRLEINL